MTYHEPRAEILETNDVIVTSGESWHDPDDSNNDNLTDTSNKWPK